MITHKELSKCPGILHAHAETEKYLACVYPVAHHLTKVESWLEDRGFVVVDRQHDDMGRIVLSVDRA